MFRRVTVAVVVGVGLVLGTPLAASAIPNIPGIDDCKDAPTPETPGRGITGWFESQPTELPPLDDPFSSYASTTVVEQYGYAGLRWNTYDLGCGPDVSRNPDAVVGTAVANWIFNLPKAMAALTTSVTETAFEPTFLQVFDPLVTNVSTTLHDRVFTAWVPLTIAVLGLWLIFKARRASLATSTAAIGWALLVLVVTATLFRWPLEAGRFADESVSATLGGVAGGLTDSGAGQTPGAKAAANVHEAMLYQAWLAGTFGSANSETAKRYGPELFQAQTFTWREAQAIEQGSDADRDRILDGKRDEFKRIAEEVKDADPNAYDYLTGKRSETRVGYAVLASIAALCALPFLLVSSLLIIAAFLIVRFAVMFFPAFAVLGLFPSARGLVIGIFRTVGAALVNAVIFGAAAAITVRGMGIILDPRSQLPGWLAIVLMLVFSLVMWVATRPFRRLTTMVSSSQNRFEDAAGAVGSTSRKVGRTARHVGRTAVATFVGGVGAGATMELIDDDSKGNAGAYERAEAAGPPAEEPLRPDRAPELVGVGAPTRAGPARASPSVADGVPGDGHGGSANARVGASASARSESATPGPRALPAGFVPKPSEAKAPLDVTEPEWVDGEEVYVIYRPTEETSDDDGR